MSDIDNSEVAQRIFDELQECYLNNKFVEDKSGCKLVEILGFNVVLDPMDSLIDLGFRKTNEEYCQKELDWYNSQDLSVKDIGKVAKIWNDCACRDGLINSNYGYLIYSDENGNQYENCKLALLAEKSSRRAIMIYNRPSIHKDAFENDRNDFICTLAHQFFIRDNKLFSIVTMRSNDFIFGFLNDFFWFSKVHQKMLKDLQKTYPDLECGEYLHSAGSLHVYERHFKYFKIEDED